MLDLQITKTLGEMRMDVAFRTSERVTALTGPSGAGKTSILNMIAGLIAPDGGSIAIDGQTLFDAGMGINIPAHQRRIGYVFQEGRLFPHLNVLHNLRYGRRLRGQNPDLAEEAKIVQLLDLSARLHRSTRDLSGGEKQRVAIGRALLSQPRLLLLDEPLASLDASRKAEILPFLLRLKDEMQMPMIYVSHAMEEVAALAGQAIEIRDGRQFHP